MKNKIIDAVDLPDQVLDELVVYMQKYKNIYGDIWNSSIEAGIHNNIIFNGMLNSFINFMAERFQNERIIKSIQEITSKLIEDRLNDLREENKE